MAYFISLFEKIVYLLYPTIFLFFTIIVALFFWKKRFSKILLGIGTLYFYFSANGMIPTLLMRHLENSFKPINDKRIVSHRAMIVLGGGVSYYPNDFASLFTSDARILEAYRIYKIAKIHKIQYTVFLTGGCVNKHKAISEAMLYKKTLMRLGVPSQYIITENRSLITEQNAQYLKPILKTYPFKTYILVTSAFHMNRARDYFASFNIKTIPAPSDYPYPVIRWLPSSYNLEIQAIALHEYTDTLRLRVCQYLQI